MGALSGGKGLQNGILCPKGKYILPGHSFESMTH